MSRGLRVGGLVLALVVASVVVVSSRGFKRLLVKVLDPEYAHAVGAMQPTFDGADAARPRVDLALVPVGRGFDGVTDVQFPPGRSDRAVVLQKAGTASWLSVADGASGPWFELEVETVSEQGLLGLAFAPDFDTSGRFALHYSPAGASLGRIELWRTDPAAPLGTAPAARVRVVLEVEQPYQNHDGGQVAFGPDGMLYIGLGDGGFRDDPDGNGQDPHTWLGAMLRVDVRASTDAAPYAVPGDNPFAGRRGAGRPEVYAIGLRNPWRFSFTPDGRLIAGDVGQDAWEEITEVVAGANLGWKAREGARCYLPDPCEPTGMLDPIWEYPHEEGRSITGGYVSTAPDLPALQGRYVFGDFVTGRLWALELPPPGARAEAVTSLGRWPITPSTFGRDGAGRLYVGDYGGGVVYRLGPAPL